MKHSSERCQSWHCWLNWESTKPGDGHVPGFTKKQAAALRLGGTEVLPVSALLFQAVVAQATQYHIIGPCLFRMQFKAIPLEVLRKERAFSRLLVGCRRNGIPKDGKPSILLPILREAPVGAIGNARNGEAKLRALGTS